MYWRNLTNFSPIVGVKLKNNQKKQTERETKNGREKIMTKAQKASMTRRRNKEAKIRMAKARAETLRIVESGVCPYCGAGLRRNLALTGWWQCEQFGAVGFRKHAELPQCSWQGFTD